MAAIHAVDLEAAGLADLARHEGYIARQLKRWYGQWNQQKTRELPLVDEVHDALVGLVPEQGPATIVHGDYRLDNTIVSDAGDVVAVLDWEICTLGDPLADVGLLQVYWTGPGDEPTRLGRPVDDGRRASGTAPTLADRYAEVSGRDLTAARLLRRLRVLEAGLHPRGRLRPLRRRRPRRPRPRRAGRRSASRSTAPPSRPPSTWSGCDEAAAFGPTTVDAR